MSANNKSISRKLFTITLGLILGVFFITLFFSTALSKNLVLVQNGQTVKTCIPSFDNSFLKLLENDNTYALLAA